MTAATLRQIAGFTVLALALHIAAFLQFGDAGGSSGTGDGGDALVSVLPSNASVRAMVADWTRSPEASSRHPTPPQQVSAAPSLPKMPAPAPTEQIGSPAPERLPMAVTADKPPSPNTTPAPAPALLPSIAEKRPAPRPERLAADPAPDRRASGTGGGATAGQAGRAEAAIRNPAARAALQAAWSASIQSRIARHQSYPRGNHGDGRVKIQMVILKSGELSAVSLAASSGRAALDNAALRAVQNAAPFPPAPDGLEEDWYRVAQWMSFRR